MVYIRFKISVHAIIFMLLQFVAYSLQDTEKMVGIATDKILEEGLILSQQEKDTMNVVRINAEVVVKHTSIGGRKMMKNLNEEQINGDEVASSSSSSINTRNGGQKMAWRTKKIHHQHHDPDSDHEVVKMSSNFMALNAADYHVPRSHPPRNN